eukprot:1157328-Pelagomonas_calceolata.AAC.1
MMPACLPRTEIAGLNGDLQEEGLQVCDNMETHGEHLQKCVPACQTQVNTSAAHKPSDPPMQSYEHTKPDKQQSQKPIRNIKNTWFLLHPPIITGNSIWVTTLVG